MSGRRAKRTLQPAVLRWARERAGLGTEALARKLRVAPKRVDEWERSGRISIALADRLAQSTHTPLGYLYLREPPDEELPVPDFRAPAGRNPRPSPELLDTVYLMARRQTWMRKELIEDDADPLPFVGCCPPGSPPADAAAAMRQHLDLEPRWAARQRSWQGALRHLRERAEAAGILVMINGIVGNNTHRKLDPGEFRGFAMIDDYAPLIFVSGADLKAAQMFTLAHEIAHVFAGAAGVSSLDMPHPDHDVARFCNSVAAEFLVPGERLRAVWRRTGTLEEALEAMAKQFKVSVLVAACRALDLQLIDRGAFRGFYDTYAIDRADERNGGNFWNTQHVAIGDRFGEAVRRAAKEGRLSYREAYALTGVAFMRNGVLRKDAKPDYIERIVQYEQRTPL